MINKLDCNSNIILVIVAVIIFSKTEDEHSEHLMKVIKAFTEAHMRISSEKSFFFEEKLNFWGILFLKVKL